MSRLIMNIGGLTSFFPVPVFLRWDLHHGMQFFPGLTVSGTRYKTPDLQTYLDANMELADPLPAGATLYEHPIRSEDLGLTYALNLDGIAMKCTWDGGAAITSISGGGDAGTVTANLAGRSCTFAMEATKAGAPQGGNYTANSWLGFVLNPALGAPPTNIKVFPAAYESRLLAGEIFDPDWFAETTQWHVLRLMDWQKTNGSNAVDFADLATESYRYFGDSVITNGNKIGPSLATIAALANQTAKPTWICIPHQFTDAAITAFAEYLRDNVSPSIMIYVEWSNEVWNTAFAQTSYAQTQGGLVSGNPWSGDSASSKGNKYAGLRAAQTSEIFRTVFGTDSGTRWTGVLCTQLGSTGVIDRKLIGVAYHIANDAGAADTAAKLFSHIGIAPYIGPTPVTAASGVGQTLAGWADTSIALDDDYAYFKAKLYGQLKFSATADSTYKNIKHWRTQWQSHITTAATNGMTCIMYEGGNGTVCALPLRDNNSGETEGTKLNLAFANFAASHEAAILEASMNGLFLSDGGILACKFTDIGPHSKYGPWGASQYLGDTNPVAANARNWNDGKIPFFLGSYPNP